MKIYWLNADPIGDLKDANCATKRLHKKDSAMSLEQWDKLLRAEHSTLRFLSLVIHDEDCPYTVACQIVRHTKEHTQPEMSSGRPDWTGKPRDYTQSRWLHVKFTPVGLIRMMEDRRCSKAEKTTWTWANNVFYTMMDSDDIYIKALAKHCQPTCSQSKQLYCKHGGCE